MDKAWSKNKVGEMLPGALMSLIAALVWVGVVQASLDLEPSVRFELPPRQPRIYARAPSGVGVTRVRAIYTNERKAAHAHEGAGCDPRYYPFPQNDIDPQFRLDECEGIIQTAKSVEKGIGEHYTLKVIAVNAKNITLGTQDLTIEVVTYNTRSPYLNDSYNSLELFEETKVGSVVMTLHANDLDPESYNRELFYFIQDPALAGKDPWLYPTTSPLRINSSTGEISVSTNLAGVKSPQFFYVGVGDGGSPHRLQTVKMILDIRKMSAPVNAVIEDMGKTNTLICWSPPTHGTPLGYLFTYRNSYRPQQMNLSMDDLLTRSVSHPSKGLMTTTHCYQLANLETYSHYIIDIKAWNDEGLSMSLKTPLTLFTRGQVCTDSLCGNGICQESNHDPGYSCICSRGYYGDHCQLKTPCVKQDADQSTCDTDCLNDDNLCLCTSAISEGECPLSSRCFSKPSCFTSDHCASSPIKDFYCYCNFKFEGRLCPDKNKRSIINTLKCKESVTSHIEGDLSWPEILVGGTIILPCPNYLVRESRATTPQRILAPIEAEVTIPQLHYRLSRSTKGMYEQRKNQGDDPQIISKSATRKCQENGQWGPPDLSGCRRLWEYSSKATSEDITSGNFDATESEVDVEDVRVGSPLQLENSKEAVEQSIKKLIHFAHNPNDKPESEKEIGEALESLLVSNITLVDEDKSRTTDLIMDALHQFSSNVRLRPGDNLAFKTPNVVLETRFLLKDDIEDEVSFRPSFEDSDDESRVMKEDDSTTHQKTKDTKDSLVLTIPKEALDTIDEDKIRVQFISFKDDRLFQGRSGQVPLKMPVISASILNHKIEGLKNPIRFKIPFPPGSLVKGVAPKCVFWDEPKSEWSQEGLDVSDWDDDAVLCLSNHLTAFSVLLDPIAEPLDPTHQTAFSFITYTGLALSTAALLLTIATYALFRCLNRDRSGAIVMNLSLALLLLNISFIGASLLTPDYVLCTPASVLVHYAVTASFTWMLIEALNMHSLLVTVFPSVETHFMVKRVGTGWGFPVLLVTAALMWEKGVYVNTPLQQCIISPVHYPSTYYSTYFAPICIILGVNCVVFLLVSKVLCRRRLQGSTKQKESPPGKPSHKRFPVTLAQIRGAITVVALLGVTWIAGVFSVGTFRVFFQYVFCIATPLQGFIIFFVRVIQSAEARAAWSNFLTTGSRTRRHKHHHQLSSLRTQSSSQNAPSVNTQSTGFGNQKNVFVSALRLARRLSLANENQSTTPSSSNTPGSLGKKTLGERLSNGLFQRSRKKSQTVHKENEDQASEACQKLNQVYGLFLQPESSHLAPNVAPNCSHNSEPLDKDFYSTDVIPFERESDDDRRREALISCMERSPSLGCVSPDAPSQDFRYRDVEKSLSLHGYASNKTPLHPTSSLKDFIRRDSTM